MFFFLDYRFNTGAGAVSIQPFETGAPALSQTNTLYLRNGFQRLESLETPAGVLLLLGDPVWSGKAGVGHQLIAANGQVDETKLYEEIRGHYYWFLVHPGGIRCGASFGAIYPVYYHRSTDRVLLSSSAAYLAEAAGAEAQNRRNLLERLLFNYPFFNSTWWQGVHLLDAHRHLRIDRQGAEIDGIFEIHHHFGTGKKAAASDMQALTAAFDQECRLFLPKGPMGISFTGGFDGRTLVAAALKAGRTDFFTYSFGRPGASDVTFPALQTRQLRMEYQPIFLDDQYLDQHAAESAFAFQRLTEYNGNLGRPHYHYAARLLATRTNFILTGNFGSEMFRALHQPGVMMTENLIRLFAAPGQTWKDAIRAAVNQWDETFFLDETEALIADLEQYLAPMQGWEPNHRFYHFVFNEVFRKYFGPELVMQSHYLNNRTPFLSLRFFQALNETIWSGVHSQLFEKKKNKRLKGQLFYASFIRDSVPGLYHLNTNKGYSPADVLESWRLPLLVGKVALTKYIRRQETDSNSEDSFLGRHLGSLLERVNTRDDGTLGRSGMAKRLETAVAQNNFDTIIQLCSIAEGWNANSGSLVNY